MGAVKPLINVGLFTSGGQINNLSKFKRQDALKYFLKIESKNLIRRLNIFVPSTGHQNCLDKSLAVDSTMYLFFYMFTCAKSFL